MSEQHAGEPRLDQRAGRTFRATFGYYTQHRDWRDRRALSWSDLVSLLTTYAVGPKEGTCIVPAVFRGDRRRKEDAEQIDVAFLDCDSGAPLGQIQAAIAARGWRAIIASTHSHLTTTTTCKRQGWDKHRDQHGENAAGFLVADKGYLPRVAVGAVCGSHHHHRRHAVEVAREGHRVPGGRVGLAIRQRQAARFDVGADRGRRCRAGDGRGLCVDGCRHGHRYRALRRTRGSTTPYATSAIAFALIVPTAAKIKTVRTTG